MEHITDVDVVPVDVVPRVSGALELQRTERITHGCDRQWFVMAVVVAGVIAVKMIVLGAGLLHAQSSRINRSMLAHNYHIHTPPVRYERPGKIDLYDLWLVSDAQWYMAIASHGYPKLTQINTERSRQDLKLIAEVDTELKYSFFPLWPLLICIAGQIIPPAAGAFFLANIMSIAASVLLLDYLRRLYGNQIASWTVMLLVTSPFALYLHIPFTESLFLMLSVLVFRATQKQNWLAAAVWVGLGAITRPNGALLGLVPMISLLEISYHRRGVIYLLHNAAVLSLSVIPLGMFCLLNLYNTHVLTYFRKTIHYWGYTRGMSLANLIDTTWGSFNRFNDMPWHTFHSSKLEFLLLIPTACMALLAVTMLPLTMSIYTVVMMLFPLMAKSDLMSYARYSFVIWPLYLTLVLLIAPQMRNRCCAGLGIVFISGQIVLMTWLVDWRWVA